MTQTETLNEIIARLKRENVKLAADVKILQQVRARNLREIEIAERRLAANEDVIKECGAQLVQRTGADGRPGDEQGRPPSPAGDGPRVR